jgi:hypothetical protein
MYQPPPPPPPPVYFINPNPSAVDISAELDASVAVYERSETGLVGPELYFTKTSHVS